MTRTVLISGGTDGVGKAAVKLFLANGNNVVTFSRSREKCDALGKELGSRKNLLIETGDVAEKADLQRILKGAKERFGRIDVLVNNAGFGYFSYADEVDMEKVEPMLRTNVLGLELLTALVLPEMKERKKGTIINISSISGKTSFPRSSFYSATKFAVMGFSEGLRHQGSDRLSGHDRDGILRRRGIRDEEEAVEGGHPCHAQAGGHRPRHRLHRRPAGALRHPGYHCHAALRRRGFPREI